MAMCPGWGCGEREGNEGGTKVIKGLRACYIEKVEEENMKAERILIF